jgi:hypothetical protein
LKNLPYFFFFLAGPYFLGRGARARCNGQYIIHPQNLCNWRNLGLGVFWDLDAW